MQVYTIYISRSIISINKGTQVQKRIIRAIFFFALKFNKNENCFLVISKVFY
jgi:hypothetical protein